MPAKPVIAAQGIKFDTANLIVPAGRPFELTFNNNDAGVPHNVEIESADKSQTLFDGDVVNGVTSVTYNVPALPPGHVLLPVQGPSEHERHGHGGSGIRAVARRRPAMVAGRRRRHRHRVAS